MSIWIRKKQARAEAAKKAKERAVRHPKPALQALSLPEDVCENGVRVILIGDSRALVENHLGVADVRPDAIRLATRSGILSVTGQELRLTDVRSGALTVAGRIEAVWLPSQREEAVGHD